VRLLLPLGGAEGGLISADARRVRRADFRGARTARQA